MRKKHIEAIENFEQAVTWKSWMGSYPPESWPEIKEAYAKAYQKLADFLYEEDF